jgi:hypothetical protein
LKPPALIAGLDGVAVMGNRSSSAVSHSRGPFSEGEIGGDETGGALVEPADEMEQTLAPDWAKGKYPSSSAQDNVGGDTVAAPGHKSIKVVGEPERVSSNFVHGSTAQPSPTIRQTSSRPAAVNRRPNKRPRTMPGPLQCSF